MPVTGNSRLSRFFPATELTIIVAMAPALVFPTPSRLMVLFLIPALWVWARVATGRFVPSTPINPALWLMLAMVGVSLHTTFDVRFSLDKISGVILGALLFWAISRWLTTFSRLRLGTAVFIAVGAVLALVGVFGVDPNRGKGLDILAAIAQWPVAIRNVPGAEQGFNPNAVAGCLVLFVPFQAAVLAATAKRWWFRMAGTGSRRVGRSLVFVQALLLLLTAGAVMLMQSRGAWLGLVAATVAFLAWYSPRTRAMMAIATAVGLVLLIAAGPITLIRQTVDLSEPDGSDAIGLRVALWSKAIHFIQDSPVTGIGMNIFRKAAGVQLPPPYPDPAHAHNNLLQTSLDLGIPGLIAYTSIWLIAALLLVMVYRRSRNRVHRAMAGGLGGGLIAHFVFGLADAIPLGSKVGVTFWLTVALTVALHRVVNPTPEAHRWTDT